MRTLQRSIHSVARAALASVFLVSPLTASSAKADQQSVQRPFEAGRYEEALEAANENRDDPASTFMAGQAAIKMDRSDRAREEFSRLESNGDRTWRAVGRSALALLDNNADQAMNAANEAIGDGGENPFAHYQLGMVASSRGNYGRAAEAFSRAAELKPDFAYAHYYAGMAYQRQRQIGKAREHFDRFLDLAPNAPERSAVVAILKTLRG